MSKLAYFDEADLADMFQYLDELRARGETNMFGAGAYVEEEYALDFREARSVVSAWMDTFGDVEAKERAAKALAADKTLGQ